MLISGRVLIMILAALVVVAGVIMWFDQGARWLAWVNIFCGVATMVLLIPRVTALTSASVSQTRREGENINELSAERRRELVRGTSLYLRELNYRYSIRLDPTETADHKLFTAEVNTVRLGFVPVVIIDNTNDRQGLGYVAFVHDGKRWRGPGLPCPAGQVEAVRHAAKCVSPLATEEETRF